MLDRVLRNVTTVGAAGKTGSGIALLLLQEMTRLEVERNPTNKIPDCQLNLVDSDPRALKDLVRYLRKQLIRYAEKRIVSLRTYFRDRPDLADNSEVIDEFVDRALLLASPATEMACASKSALVFEAICERLEDKRQLFARLKEICPPETYFFADISSFPISAIEESAAIEGRLVGYRFRNRSAVQNPVELVVSKSTPSELKRIAENLETHWNRQPR